MSDEEGDETNAMRQMMGFSSFGTSQRPKKEPQEPTSGAFSASGANSAPIAKRAKTNNTTSKIQPLSSSPPTFRPASVAPQPTSAASFGTMSSAQSYDTAREQQSVSGLSPNTLGSWSGPLSGRSLLSYSMQAARYAPPPGAVASLPSQDARYAPSGTLPSPPNADTRPLPSPGITFGPGVSHPLPAPGIIFGPAPARDSNFTYPTGPPAYTNPDSGISFTRQELSNLKVGRNNERGDLVYFQPSFVDPNPWLGLKKAGARAGS